MGTAKSSERKTDSRCVQTGVQDRHSETSGNNVIKFTNDQEVMQQPNDLDSTLNSLSKAIKWVSSQMRQSRSNKSA